MPRAPRGHSPPPRRFHSTGSTSVHRSAQGILCCASHPTARTISAWLHAASTVQIVMRQPHWTHRLLWRLFNRQSGIPHPSNSRDSGLMSRSRHPTRTSSSRRWSKTASQFLPDHIKYASSICSMPCNFRTAASVPTLLTIPRRETALQRAFCPLR